MQTLAHSMMCAAAAGLAVAACSRPAAKAPPDPAAAEQARADAPGVPAVAPGERTIEVSDGARLYVKVSGSGPVCLFVHGGPGQGTLSFEKMGGDALEDFLTVIYLDQRGSGKSPDAGDYHLDRVVQDLEEVRRHLGQQRLCLIAHSFGGILAVEYARRYPRHVSKLVMANATLHFLSEGNLRMQIEAVNALLGRKVVEVPDDAGAEVLAEAHRKAMSALGDSGLGYRRLARSVDTIRAMMEIDSSYERSRGYGRAVITQRDALPEYYEDYAPVTASIPHPVLVIAGAVDYAVGPAEHERFRFPNQKVVVLDSGHLPYYENTAEFAGAIRQFASGPDRSGP